MPTKSEKWGGIAELAQQWADYVYSVGEDGALDPDKTAGDIEAEMRVYLEAELRRRVEPLLEAADKLCADYQERSPWQGADLPTNELCKELDQWR